MSGQFKAGQILANGTVEIIERLVTGGVGEVYRIAYEQGGTRSTMVLKCFNPEILEKNGLAAIEMVHRESAAVSKIRHPGIINIVEVGLQLKTPYLVEEFLAGGDLLQLIEERKLLATPQKSVLTHQEIAYLGYQISSALGLLHQNSIFHGDLKPANLCFRNKEALEIVLVDFGHAGLLEGNLLDRNESSATFAYLPPERTGFVKLAGSASSDLYSLGLILYECAIGVQALQSRNGRDLINRLLFEVPEALHEVFPDFPLVLSDIISKLIRKNPADRYHSAFGLSADLERCWRTLAQQDRLGYFALASKDKLRELNYRIPMVGRKRELETLHRLLDEALQGAQAVALIGAPSGSGKSRLAFEIMHKARLNSCLISFVKFSEYERNLPLSAINLLLVEHCHYLRGLSAEQLWQWRDRVKQKIGDRVWLIRERFEIYAPYLPKSDSPRHSINDQSFETFNQTLGEFLSLLAAAGETQVLFIDDMQWADWQSLQVLANLAQRISDAAAHQIMLLGTFRSDEIDPNHILNPSFLIHKDKFTLLQLESLARSEANSLVEMLLDEQGSEVKKLEEYCYSLTAGNPLFIYEYLKSVISNGVFGLDEATQSWSFNENRLGASDLSSGVTGLLVGRIRSLSQLQQIFISMSSVAGHVMRRSDLKLLFPVLAKQRQLNIEAIGSSQIDLNLELCYQELVQKKILAPDPVNFAFFHDKVQEAAYSLLGDDEKCLLHHHFGLLCIEHLKAKHSNVNDSDIFQAVYHICRGRNTDLPAEVRQFMLAAARSAKQVFAYEKSKEYLTALLKSLESEEHAGSQERFDALELLADVLSISEQVAEAMQIYDQLLSFDCEPTRRAHIYAKKVEFCINFFDYKNARSAAKAALDVLGERIITSEIIAYLYIFFALPVLVIYSFYFKFFGKKTKEITSDRENIRLLLLSKSKISEYFTQPVLAIANHISLTFELLSYKDNDYRAAMMCYWGIGSSAFGFTKFSRFCFQHAYDYFDKMANPVEKGFVLFCWAFLNDMPRGDLLETQKKLEEAVFNLAPVGETFWRSASILGLILLDYWGAESGQAASRCHEYLEIRKKVGGVATTLGCVLRYELEALNEAPAQILFQQVMEGDADLQNQGFDSVDNLIAYLTIAEYYCYLEDFEKAESLAQRAFAIGFSRLHRVTYSQFSPIVYARILIHRKKKWRALAVLACTWIDQLLKVRVFRPQCCYESGRWLELIGLPRCGRWLVERGIRYAARRDWWTPEAEGQILLGEMLIESQPILAKAYILLAKDYFALRQWKFQCARADKALAKIALLHSKVSNPKPLSTTQTRQAQATQIGSGIRQQVEVLTLLDILLKLSAISNKDELFRALMESLSQATGSELAILYFNRGNGWHAEASHNRDLAHSAQFNSKVDQSFIQHTLLTLPKTPVVRRAVDAPNRRPLTTGSALLLPMKSNGEVTAYCYLANTQIYDLFDARSLEIAQPIANQGAIALDNIRLNQQLAVERDEIAKLNQTLEVRVIEQTRDIKSIMQHIQLGICTISGEKILINKDYSSFLEPLLGEQDLHNKMLIPLLFSDASSNEDEVDQVKQTLFLSLGAPRLGFEINRHMLPQVLQRNNGDRELMFELDWIPICNDDDEVERILLTVNDVTELRSLQMLASRTNEDLQIVGEILARSARDWSLFIVSSGNLLADAFATLAMMTSAADSYASMKNIFVLVHTLKGNARAMGFRSLNQKIHLLEQFFADLIRDRSKTFDKNQVKENLLEIEALVNRYDAVATQKLGRTSKSEDLVSIPRQSLRQIYEYLQRQPRDAMRESIQSLRTAIFTSVSGLLQQLSFEIGTLAGELAKAPPKLHLEVPELWLDQELEGHLRSILIHLMRNSLDHGLEASEERIRKGLAPYGTLSFIGKHRDDWVEIVIEDDGRGLNLNKLRQIGLERQLLSELAATDPQAVAKLMFSPNLSTAEQLTDVSGRGFGMLAVKHLLEQLSGSLTIHLHQDRVVEEGYSAFALSVRLPAHLFLLESSVKLTA